MQPARIFGIVSALVFCLALPPCAGARESAPPLRYKFSAGQTNVYQVELSVRSENGQETTSGNLFIIPQAAGSNVLRLSCRAMLTANRSPGRPPFMNYGGMYPGTGVRLPEGCELQIDNLGRVLRTSGDYPLPVPLGELLQTLIEPLPAALKTQWETTDESSVMDDPLWLGPGKAFFGSQNFGPPFFMNYGPRSPLAVITATRHVTWHLTGNTPATVTFHKQLSLVSLLQTSHDHDASPFLRTHC